MQKFSMYIGGEWRESASGRTFPSIDPYTGESWAELPYGDAEDVDLAVAAARKAFESEWGTTLGSERSRVLRQIAEGVQKHADHLAYLETRDNGKLIREMSGQVKYLANYYHYFAGAADKIHVK